MPVHRHFAASVLTALGEPNISMASGNVETSSLKIQFEKLDQQTRVLNQLHDITSIGGPPFATAKLVGYMFDTGTLFSLSDFSGGFILYPKVALLTVV